MAPPFKIAEFDIMFGEGISYAGDILNSAIKYGVIGKSGNTYSFENEKLGVGIEAAREKLNSDKILLNKIKNSLKTPYWKRRIKLLAY